jgi:hypothetical protein
METIVIHPSFGQGKIDSDEKLENKMVTVFFDDKKYRQVHGSLLKVKKNKYDIYFDE